MESTITRAALGISASLGDLYDARRDDFCGVSIFKKTLPAEAVTLRDTPFSDVTLLHTDDYSSKFQKLDVNAELQVSILGGLFKLEGSGHYLSDQKKSARSVKSSLIYNIKTKEESLNIRHEALKEAFAIDGIQTGVATHVVVGISWGANSILTCQFDNNENQDVTEIGGKLSAHMSKLALSISGSAGVDYKDGNSSGGFKTDVRMFGDVVAANEELPTTAEAALQLMKRMPSLVSAANSGKGKPLSYRLLPISLLKTYLNFTLQVDVVIKSLEEASLIRVVQFFDQFSNAKQKLNDFLKDVAHFNYCLPSEDYHKVMELKGKIEVEESKMRRELANELTAVRSGRSDGAKMEEMLQKFNQSEMSPQKIELIFTTWSSLLQKINFARTLVQNGVKYIGLAVSLEDELLKVFENEVFVLYFTQRSATDGERWQGNKQLFMTAVNKKQSDQKFFAVDCDIYPNLMKSGKTSVLKVWKEGRVVNEDLLEDEQFLINNPMVKATVRATKINHKPNKRVPLAIACTGDNCDPAAVYEWICHKCRKPAEYGFDQFMYCACGKVSASALEFRCPDPKHGLTFKKHDADHLSTLLQALRAFKEMNILILGETGVGKSTWINSFVNFVQFDTLEEAVNGDLITLIPTNFTVMNDNYEEVVVKAGDEDPNEVQAVGQSATQSAKVYPFTIGDTVVQLIDTPGIGDTRGVEQDKKNFESILGTLSYHDEIHGICILLKPNSARLSVTFRFCIKELLTYLHKDASQNIVFCFTNSRGTFYKPGDTLPALRKLLSENKNVNLTISRETIYCFDSESYRFLAAIKNKPPVSFTDSERQDFSFSWQKSMNETKRMLLHIKTLPPHETQNMLNLNFSRKLVLKLSRPLADITRNIQLNKTYALDEIAVIKEMEESIEELSKRKMIKRTQIKNTRIKHPKTVCTHASCIDTRTLEGQGQQVAFYRQICHDPCSLRGINEDLIGDPKLYDCFAIKGNGDCGLCGHRYTVHAHFWYDSALEEVDVIDQTVANSLKKNKTAAEMKRSMLRKREKEVKEYEAELKEIENASIRFAYFLKANAITPHNDAMEQYLEFHIREERERLAVVKGRNPALLEGLLSSLSSYRSQRDILESAMQKGTSGERPPTGADVNELVAKLKGLKHTGKSLEEALDAVQSSRHVTYNEVQRSPSHKPTKKAVRFWDAVFAKIGQQFGIEI